MKRARKATNRARYAAMAASGSNSKRSRLAAKRKRTVRVKRHVVANCGNVGCTRCFPREINS
jgi:hypothetical protein